MQLYQYLILYHTWILWDGQVCFQSFNVMVRWEMVRVQPRISSHKWRLIGWDCILVVTIASWGGRAPYRSGMHEFLHRFSCIFRPVAVEIVGADGANGLRTWSRMNFVVKTWGFLWGISPTKMDMMAPNYWQPTYINKDDWNKNMHPKSTRKKSCKPSFPESFGDSSLAWNSGRGDFIWCSLRMSNS